MDLQSPAVSAMPARGPDREAAAGRTEIEPLLYKACQTAAHYGEALNCSTAVVDRTGRAVEIPEAGDQMRFCAFCKKRPSGAHGGAAKIRDPYAGKRPGAIAEQGRAPGAYVYTCDAGFIYWTSPLYRNGRYAGAMIAGQVLLDGRKPDRKKLRGIFNDKTSEEEFRLMLDEAPGKKHEEIEAMARLLEVCAGEISKKRRDLNAAIRRIARSGDGGKGPREAEDRPGFAKPRRPAQEGGDKSLSLRIETDAEFPLEKERMLLAAFRRGDNETGCRILKDLMDGVGAAVPENYDIIRFRAIELAVLLSRSAAVSESSNVDSLLEANNRHLRRLQESKTPEELIENLRNVAENMADKIFSFQGLCHASALRKAERYIWENYTRKISLDEIAKASGLSAPYFSTVFKEEMNENLSHYLNRLRIERAAALLTGTGKTLNEIAKLCGFEDQSWFSKIFKKLKGMSPGKYRDNCGTAPEFEGGA